jgi:predicted Zn-dependent protease
MMTFFPAKQKGEMLLAKILLAKIVLAGIAALLIGICQQINSTCLADAIESGNTVNFASDANSAPMNIGNSVPYASDQAAQEHGTASDLPVDKPIYENPPPPESAGPQAPPPLAPVQKPPAQNSDSAGPTGATTTTPQNSQTPQPDTSSQVQQPTGQNNFPPEALIPEFGQPLAPSNSAGQVPPPSPPARLPTNQIGNQTTPGRALFEQADRLSRLEQNIFGASYPEHDPYSRLEHLERETLGQLGTGSFEERLAILELRIGGQPAFGSGGTNGGNSGTEQSASGATCGDSDVSLVIRAISSDPKAGDYFSAIRPITGNQLAHWSKFPVRIHLPSESPEAWEKHLVAGIKKWNQYIPLSTVSGNDSADIDVTWINHLVPRLLGITRLVVVQGHMHVQIYMLRPTFYEKEVPEHALAPAFLHELGHALGLAGHSNVQADVMYPIEYSPGEKPPMHSSNISARDINTLKRVYEAPGLASDYSTTSPIEWGSF